MADHSWNHEAIFDSPVVRQDVEQRIKLERPAAPAVQQPPPAPELRAVLDNPQMAAAFWGPAPAAQPFQQPLNNAPVAVQQAEPQPTDSEAVIQVGLALYLLQAIHFPEKPGYEHLPRETRRPRRLGENDDVEGVGA